MTTVLAKNLRARSEQLGLTNNEVARRAGLHERRYANYVIGRREPDIATLAKLAEVLRTSPNELLGFSPQAATKRNVLEDRMLGAMASLSLADAEVIVAQAEALLKARQR